MDTYRTIITKRDTRVFLERDVPEETRRRILQAGRMAGSSKNSQPCRFIVLRDPKVRQQFSSCGDFAGWLPQAPFVVAVAVVTGTRGEFDAGRAAQNMMLAAWAEGVTSCPVSLHRQECAVETLALPAGARVPVAVGFGYRAKPPKHVSEGARLAWDEYVYTDRFEPRT